MRGPAYERPAPAPAQRAGWRARSWRLCAITLALVLAPLSGVLDSAGARLPVARPATARPQILFGLGSEADGARTSHLAKTAPLGMLSSWYNGPSDLRWMSSWETTEVPRDYAAGYNLHLIVWTGESRSTLSTPHGVACGMRYPLSAGFLKNMEQLAHIFRGPTTRTLYVTLFSEFQTYACNGNEWSGSPQTTAYYETLKEQYLAALQIFHRVAPNSKVSLGWGGWQARWTGLATGAGRALFKHFADVMRASDFESFEVINSTQEKTDLVSMTRHLAPYGPVMVAYYRPPDGPESVVDAHLTATLAPSFLERLAGLGVFAMGFMSEAPFEHYPTGFTIVSEAVKAFGCTACGLPG